MIRIVTSIILSLVIAYCNAQTANLEIGNSAFLTYEQTINGVKNEVKLTINKDAVTAVPKVSWSVHTGDKSFSKIYNYSAKSVDNSNILYLRIDESLIPLPDANVALVSNKVFEEITKGKTMFRINGGTVTGFEVIKDKSKIILVVNGKNTMVDAYHLKSVGDAPSQELWILNNMNNPVVLRAFGVYNFLLTEVKL
jgi:hypothetical protein